MRFPQACCHLFVVFVVIVVGGDHEVFLYLPILLLLLPLLLVMVEVFLYLPISPSIYLLFRTLVFPVSLPLHGFSP